MKITGRNWAGLRAIVWAMGSMLAAGQWAQAQLVTVGNGGPGPVKAEHLTVELTQLSPQIAAGGTAKLGLVMTIEEHWHVYWVNAGYAGGPPTIKWTLPAGISAGPLQFPAPVRLPLGPYMDYGYEDQVAFPVTLTAAPSTKPGKVHLDAQVSWLVCSSQCFPGKAHLGIDVDVVKGPLAEPPLVGALGEALKSLPQPLPANMSASAIADEKQILITLKTGTKEEDAELYPFDQDVIADAAEQEVESLPDGVQIRVDRATDPEHPGQSPALPKSLHMLVKLSSTESYDFTTDVKPGTLPASAPTAKKSSAAQTTDVTVFTAVLLALLGGMLLNLMPCVFPVLFLKGLALVHSSGEEKARQRAHGLMYTVGILVSFWALVAVLLVLRAGGQQLGWGFQLQSPGFVAVLASLVFFLGLSLAGQFEFGLSMTSAGGDLAQKQGLTGSFFTGVLATVVATPCMGPLMGTAVGFALAQPAWATFLVFTAVGLGLALPYLVLTIQPQWTKLLPKPGAWMETLKQLTAVPLFGTAIWLVWVFGQLSTTTGGDAGIDKMAWLLSGFLVLAIAGWALGKWPGQWKGTIVAVVLIAIAIYLPIRKPAVDTLTWKPYTQANFDAARATGDPVFIDFTAAWCLSCKYNEGAVLKSTEVEKQFGSKHFQLLKADWTQYDPIITQQLASIGRSGVPTYVIYPPGKVSNADVLPELLTKDIVLTAIAKDSKPMGAN
ncbi:protein-disulfide reductase DsbD family protein [Granulicella paludicola]|uniref:protein-disulfide reductase DsbD family protein n=1 Tax=Granulicella paludicola TaxID=474951 RepID=UPI0021E0EE74|nr:protein-disulfide reductase DsbD domain-containing protein [Granulicella paludicola]